jgi:homoserine O-succinyltransferase/O-acetyltransferase
MPVSINSSSTDSNRPPCTNPKCAKPTAECFERSSRNLTIGLINNMPDSALEATERQFLSLLDSASEGLSIRLVLYSMPGIPRNGSTAGHISRFYSSTECLPGAQLDALIVTGREPLAANLADEPYWNSFTEIVDWARSHTFATIWSCLAAHAAVQYMDGIRRIRSERKHCGILECTRLCDHFITEGTPRNFQLPHSRWNGLPEGELEERGYSLLSRAADAGVDSFCKQDKSLFVFFQGHPEYEPATLLLEYRRDVGRYLRGESDTYPSMPCGCFDDDRATALTLLQREAETRRCEGLVAEVSAVLDSVQIQHSWHSAAARIYRNWLEYIRLQKKTRLKAESCFADKNLGPMASTLEPATPASSRISLR